MLYVIVHKLSGDAFNTYSGMTREQVVSMANEMWPGSECEFLSVEDWKSRLALVSAQL